MKLGPETLFVRQIVKDPSTQSLRLEFNLSLFLDVDALLDYYHEHFLYDWSGSTVRR